VLHVSVCGDRLLLLADVNMDDIVDCFTEHCADEWAKCRWRTFLALGALSWQPGGRSHAIRDVGQHVGVFSHAHQSPRRL